MMQIRIRPILATIRAMFIATVLLTAAVASAQTLLNREKTAAILPPSVFFRGQAAPVQGRNSAGLRQPDGKLVLFAVVDTAGYSSALQQTYQAYLLTEVPLQIGDQSLAPGAYGFGFIAGDKMELMDIGGNELLHTSTTRDAALPRPTPLQLLADQSESLGTGRFRLYLGRSYVSVTVPVAAAHGTSVK